MNTSQSNTHFRKLLAASAALAFVGNVPIATAQQSSILIAAEINEPTSAPDRKDDLPPIVSIPEKIQSELVAEGTAVDHEIVRERYKNGRIKTEREVVLNEQGDFVNDGQFRQWDEKGELVMSGSYAQGKREGVWMQIVAVADSKLMQSLPYSKFKAPFHSVAEFKNDEMNGIWIITDADNKEVSQIELTNGIRSGVASWKFPNGKPLYEAYYSDGFLNGMYVERDTDGKVVRQQEYAEGRRIDIKREFYADKKPKSEMQVLTNKPRLTSKDDFMNVTLATYGADEGATQHGPFVLYHPNGAVRAKGMYVNGDLDGKYEAWHENGEKDVVGTYSRGQRVDSWVWRHPNGMRRLSGVYKQGILDGALAAWNEQGKAINPPSSPEAAENQVSRTASESTKPSRR